jgi:hypothetical protein
VCVYLWSHADLCRVDTCEDKTENGYENQASLKFFTEMLDRVMGAPINLYFDVTPIGQIQTRFGRDLGAVEGQFYNIM